MSRFLTQMKSIKHIDFLSTQVAFVLIAFLVMVVSSYFFSSILLRMNLKREALIMSSNIESGLASDLHELELVLYTVSESIRSQIISGGNFSELQRYIQEMTSYYREQTNLKGFVSIFAMFQVFDNRGFNGLGFSGAPGYLPKDQPWYITAQQSKGDIVTTHPVLDSITQKASFTFVRSIYKDEEVLAIVCIDVEIDKLYVQSSAYHGYSEQTWMLLDENLNILIYPDNLFFGKPLAEIDSGLAKLADKIKKDNKLTNVITHNHEKKLINVNVNQLNNGWFLCVSTSTENYYQMLRLMLAFLICIGMVLTCVLSAMLIKLHLQKSNVENQKEEISIHYQNILTVLDKLPEGIIVFNNEDGSVEYANQISQQMFGFKFDLKENSNLHGNELFPEKQPDGRLSDDMLKMLLESEESMVSDFKCKKKSGELFSAQITSSIINFSGHQSNLAIIENLTEEIEHQLMLENIATKEKEANQLKNQFIASISHEIRTPLHAIIGLAEIQLQEKKISPRYEEVFTRIYEAGNILLNTINDVLDFSKLEEGKLEIISAQYDLPTLVTDIIGFCEARYDNKQIIFNINVDKETPTSLFGDVTRIKQVIDNLLSNAFKYTEMGKISFTVYPKYEDDFIGNGEKSDVVMVFEISDTGQGMTKDQIDRLFEKFNKIGMNQTKVGIGLGMSITGNLVKLMNGEITVKSNPNLGSSFTISLPQQQFGNDVCGKKLVTEWHKYNIRDAHKSKKVHIYRRYMPNARVLLVDDIETNLFVAEGMLSPYGIHVEKVMTGFEAINRVKGGNLYDIIFMDHMMPELNGVETTKIIREMGYKKTIIVLTANTANDQQQQFLVSGFDEFISKPIDIRELDGVLNKYIPLDIQIVENSEEETLRVNVKDGLIQAVLHDLEKAIPMLEELTPKLENNDPESLTLYITTVHGIKSSLFNIDELLLSEYALKLEEAGKRGELNKIQSMTNDFLKKLKLVYEQLVN